MPIDPQPKPEAEGAGDGLAVVQRDGYVLVGRPSDPAMRRLAICGLELGIAALASLAKVAAPLLEPEDYRIIIEPDARPARQHPPGASIRGISRAEAKRQNRAMRGKGRP